MVMKRYPNGAAGEFFFMKRAPSPRPDWIEICNIEHESGNIINFPMIQDVASLMWVINLGCIDLNQWYARCDDVDRPDYVHFDLDPVPKASFEKVCEAALFLKLALDSIKIPSFVKTTGSKGIHIYIPIKRAIIDKNARIGKNARLLNEAGVTEADGAGGSYFIRDGIVIVPKNAVIADGTII
jgi:bifunctional non-homologous end joining protein LigD